MQNANKETQAVSSLGAASTVVALKTILKNQINNKTRIRVNINDLLTMPEGIYNSHYGNGVPVMFTS